MLLIRQISFKPEYRGWRHVPGEYAQRIWEWLNPRVNMFRVHALAIRLVVLTQLSNFSVER